MQISLRWVQLWTIRCPTCLAASVSGHRYDSAELQLAMNRDLRWRVPYVYVLQWFQGSLSSQQRMLRCLLVEYMQTSRPKAPDAGVSGSSTSGSAAGASAPDKPAHDVVAGAMARAASQSTIHPLDTMKVRMQAGKAAQGSSSAPKPIAPSINAAGDNSLAVSLRRGLAEVGSLYKGVVSAATGAGVIIGAYFAFYSTTKRFLREQTKWKEGRCLANPILKLDHVLMF